MGLWFFSARKKRQKLGESYYSFVRDAARSKWFFGADKVPDTVDGRFELLILHAFLLMQALKLKMPADRLDQLVFDAMFRDLDGALRELGTSDTQVGKKIKSMAKAFYGRSKTYHQALTEGDVEQMQSALLRNVMVDAENELQVKFSLILAKWAFESEKRLKKQSLKQILHDGPDFAYEDFC